MKKGARGGRSAGARLEWRDEVTVRQAVALKEELIRALDAHDQLHIDLSGVRDIDAAGLQLLCAGHRSAAGRNKELVVTGGERLADILRFAGFIGRPGCGSLPSCLWQEGAR